MNGNAVINYFVTQRGAGEKRTKFKRSLGIIAVLNYCLQRLCHVPRFVSGIGGTGRWWTIGRVVAAGRPEARSAGGRPWGWVSGGGRPSRKGGSGYYPRKIF
jgi:hypothetical protein